MVDNICKNCTLEGDDACPVVGKIAEYAKSCIHMRPHRRMVDEDNQD